MCLAAFTEMFWGSFTQQHSTVPHFFSLLNNIPLYAYIMFSYPFIDGHLWCFHILAGMTHDSMDIHVHVFRWTCFHFSLVYTQKFAELHSNSRFNILRKCQAVFQRTAPFSSLLAMYKAAVILYTLDNICYCFFLITNVTMLLTFIPLFTNDEFLFMCLLAICMQPWEEYLLKFLPSF